MNDHLTISTAQLFAMFPDQEKARTYLESRLWPKGVRCPICGLGDRIGSHSPGLYRCFQCKEAFSVRTGTIFERSHVPLHKWLYAMYLLVTSRKGISSLQLSKEIGITQKSAWFVLQRLREACGGQRPAKIRARASAAVQGAHSESQGAMNTKPFHLPASFGEALERLARVPKDAVHAKKKRPDAKAARASGSKRRQKLPPTG